MAGGPAPSPPGPFESLRMAVAPPPVRGIGTGGGLIRSPVTVTEVLRKEMELTQDELGERLCKSGQQIARWEKSHAEISGSAELLLRLLYLQHLGQHPLLTEIVKHLRSIEDNAQRRQLFRPTRDGWQPIAA